MTLTSSHGSGDAAVPDSANRWRAVFSSWLGGCIPAAMLFITLASTGNYDPMIGSTINFLAIGAVVAGVMATGVSIGSALVVFSQSRVVKRHGLRLNAATAICGAVGSSVYVGLSEAFGPAPNIIAMGVITIMATAVITFGVLEIMLRKQLLLPPLATRCPHCAYPIGTSAVCTECGQPVPSPSR